MTTTVSTCFALTGSAVDSLDYIDGDELADNDISFSVLAADDNLGFLHRLEASSGATEATPSVISPDTNAGTKRHLLAKLLAGPNMACVQCGRLDYTDAATVTFSPKFGNQIPVKVNSIWRLKTIPSAGITFTTTGVASTNTLYYVYAYDSSGTLTLEAATTGHSVDADTGVEIKTGDATRTLVGMFYADGSKQVAANRVASWLNRKTIHLASFLSANRSTASTSYAEVNSEIRVPFMTWGQTERIFACGPTLNDTATGNCYTAIAIDDATEENPIAWMGGSGGSYPEQVALEFGGSDPAEGYHFATVVTKVGSGNGTWAGGGSGAARWMLTVAVRV